MQPNDRQLVADAFGYLRMGIEEEPPPNHVTALLAYIDRLEAAVLTAAKMHHPMIAPPAPVCRVCDAAREIKEIEALCPSNATR